MKRASLFALAGVVAVLAGCGSSNSSSSSGASPTSSATSSSSTSASAGSSATGGASVAGSTVKVDMKNLAFDPKSVTAKVGETIQWVNDDQPPHNVTYVSGPKFTSSGTMNTGDKFQIKVTTPGTIHYVCTIHPFMKATIVVSK
jgi:plastocyanin